ncbi:VC0807 family protein [Kitasatospora sp. NPDC053057]|uniref:VC0807 family protein n=1 Tax=Kitasatospora sp. NPDC053057 TaxID=3364062 RepID=UPI0037CC7962
MSSQLSPGQVQAAHRRRQTRGALITGLLLDAGLPLLIFYGLRQQNVGVVTASLASGVLPALRTFYVMQKERRVDVVALFMVSTLILGGILGALTGDPRLMFAKDGWITGMIGLWLLITLMMRRPFFLHAGKNIALTKTGPESAEQWERRWDTEPAFRRGLRVLTAVFGVGLLLDAGVRVLIAYTVPIDNVPLVTNVQYLVLLAGLLTFMMRHTKKHNLRA